MGKYEEHWPKYFSISCGVLHVTRNFNAIVNSSSFSLADALKLSIMKWEAIVAYYKHFDIQPYLCTRGSTTCGLCRLYLQHKDGKDSCEDCPIRKRTKKHLCLGSPHEKFVLNPCLTTAQEELRFLKSLQKSRK